MMDELIHVEVIALLEEQNLKTPVILLQSRESNKVLPIWIGHPEARTIAVILQNLKTQRPLTHELLINAIENMGGKLLKIVINHMQEKTFYARIDIKKGEENIEIDSRPSDAIALALKAHVPIFATRSLMENEGQENPFHQTQAQRVQQGIRKRELTPEELRRITGLLKEAQKREQKGNST